MNEDLNSEFWDQINEIEKQTCRLNSCRSIITLCAERALDDDSGALWSAADILDDIETKLDQKIHDLLQVHKKLKEPIKKGGKKK
jgi:hypothetical protein